MKSSAASQTVLPADNLQLPFDHSTPARWSDATLYFVLILFSVVPYLNTLLNGFVYDDTTQILDNPYIVSFRHLGQIFSSAAWSYVGSGGYTNYYRPMMTFGYLICFQLFGAAPYGFHLANILLHAGVVMLLFIVTRRIFRGRAMAFLAATLFALHPIHTESVDWVAAVTDLEVTFFILLTFWFFLRVPQPRGKRSPWSLLAMIASFALALGSKEQSLMLPFLATAYEHFYREDRAKTTPLQKLSRYGYLWALLVAYFLFRERVFGAFAPIIGHPEVSRYGTVTSGVMLLGRYVWKLIWPVNLCAFYMFHPASSALDPRVLASVAVVAACAVLFAVLWKRQRAASFGMVWFFATITPVLNVRVLASDNVFAERYLYLPSVGFCWMAAVGLMKMWDLASTHNRLWRAVVAGVLGVLAFLFGERVITRNRIWHDEITFYTATLEASPDATPIYNNLGSVYWNRGDVDAAERQWQRAIQLAPGSPTILNNLGLVYLKRRQMRRAVEYFRKSADVKPAFPDPHLNLGVAYQQMGRDEDAEVQYRAALSLAPLNLHIHNRLGGLYRDEGRVEEAERQFLISASIAPNVVAFDALGGIHFSRLEYKSAEAMFNRSLALNPADFGARTNLAQIDAASGRPDQAADQYRAILKIDPQNAAARAGLDKVTAASQTNANKR